jgi:MFS family permease
MPNSISDISAEKQSLLKKTVIFDTVRSCMINPQHAAFRGSGIAVLVALQFFHGADWQKGLLAAVPFIGMALSPLAVVIASHVQITVSRLAGIMMFLMAPGLILASLAHNLWWFIIGILISVPMLGAVIPLITAMWQQNAPGTVRGKFFGRVALAGSFAGVISTLGISFWLGDEPGRYRAVMICFAVMSVIAGAALCQIPSRPVELPKKGYKRAGFHVLALLWEDKFFGYICIAQMLIGFGNLATIPLRTEFLGSLERGGMGYKAGMVFLITVVIPEIGRLLSIPLWGHLFDRLNFAIMRMSVSSCFVLSLIFTFMPSLPMQIVGAVMFGAGMGGGAIAWSLWVTKLAPAESTADYMAVHTFLTGTRGIIGPQVAFLALSVWSIPTVGIAAAGMVVISILMMAFVIPHFKGRAHE